MTMPSDTDRVVSELRALSLRAGAEIMTVYASEIAVEIKDDKTPVTAADRAADAVIVDGLKAAFPEIPVVTEERVASHTLASADEPFFLVDPLDGTKEFVNRNGEFTVNIALIADRVPVLGVVYAPAAGRLFYTVSETEAVEAALQADKEELIPLHVRTADNSALRVIASKSHRDAATNAYIERYQVAEFHSAGSSLKFCLVAAGEADFYPRLGRTMEWDTAAGHAILRAAGGDVRQLDGAPFIYGKPGFENPHFVACAPGVDTIAA